ncbi:MAG: PcfJ domain-containing protein [Bacteroidaceae bacterium]|nr:PcfJ domain-containing protein [Bacteroidaceae bacterium]
MRPRTKKQWRIVELADTLPEITKEQREYAFSHCFKAMAYNCKGEAWCTECGHTFTPDVSTLSIALEIGDKIKCPHCGEMLTLKNSQKKKAPQREYYDIITTCGEFQVFRHFAINKAAYKGYETKWYAHEVVQAWMDEKGHIAIRALPCCMGGEDRWILCGKMEIRDQNRRNIYGYRYNRYDIWGKVQWPKIKVLPLFKKRGIKTSFHGCNPRELCRHLAEGSNKAETLLKIGQYGLLDLYLKGRLSWRVYDSAIVATRHRYKIKDATMWTDMIEMLIREGKDIRNPHYICPKNLKEAHDYWLKRKQAREREAERRRRQREAEAEARKNEKLKEVYKVLQQMFSGWTFGDTDIQLHIIDNMDELKTEGEEMHHCVWDRYREMDGWLIVSARDKEDQRLATIELSTKDWRVVQCRAKHNAMPERYEEIMDVMNSSINEVRRRYERQKQLKMDKHTIQSVA